MRVTRQIVLNNRTATMEIVMGGAIIVESADPGQEDEMSYCHILYKNELADPTTSFTTVHTTGGQLDEASIPNIYYDNTTATWKPEEGTIYCDVTFDELTEINSFAIAACNSGTAEIAFAIVDLTDDRNMVAFSGVADNAPHLAVFDTILTTRMRIVIAATANCRIGQMALGKTLHLPTAPTLGLELGKFNNKDKQVTSVTEGNNIIGSSMQKRLRKTSVPIKHVPFTWVREHWVPFADNYQGALVWLGWDVKNYPEDTVYGNWVTKGSISFQKATSTDITIEVTGYTR